ncbi:methyltransferase [Stenotrophomonas pictorum JCM 9942]|uniref:Methyltransferase n=1 Tax=Stenotrophomonas pictorum JCM 9942 TaxID=1236960 RepID=A0A0R0AWV8_9GAMM|nr:class I SAM-dependent methyltransferase [Stenotrophomonas pictorum]KRG45208.1 methyltransferase [Stenotrophomonas pictorum JCM 9942]
MSKSVPLLSACLLGMSVLLAGAPAVATQAAASTADLQVAPQLQAAVAGSWRTPANVVRDAHRHPAQTLSFFGLQPTQTVVEITPGGGWYAEILAPYLRENGQYVAAVVDPQALPAGGGRDYQQRSRDGLTKKFAGSPAQFDRAAVIAFDPAAPVLGKPASADVVLTFRNVHNWRSNDQADGMFRAFFQVLKPGGTLGVVEHRAKSDVPADDKSGYVGQAQVIAMAEAAGFKLDGSSEINTNPRDTKDYPKGVWTLPPSNSHDAADAARYKAIGESDRMTLRFVKPAH